MPPRPIPFRDAPPTPSIARVQQSLDEQGTITVQLTIPRSALLAAEAEAPEPLMTIRDVATYLRVTPGAVNSWIKSKGLPVITITSDTRLVRRNDLLRWLEQHEGASR